MLKNNDIIIKLFFVKYVSHPPPIIHGVKDVLILTNCESYSLCLYDL